MNQVERNVAGQTKSNSMPDLHPQFQTTNSDDKFKSLLKNTERRVNYLHRRAIEPMFVNNDFAAINDYCRQNNLVDAPTIAGRLYLMQSLKKLEEEGIYANFMRFAKGVPYRDEFVKFFVENQSRIEKLFVECNEYNSEIWNLDVFALHTTQATFCKKVNGVTESIRLLFLRDVHQYAECDGKVDVNQVFEDYKLMMSCRVRPPTPALTNANIQGNNALTSCFIIVMENNRNSMLNTLRRATDINHSKGGIAINLSQIAITTEIDPNGSGAGPIAAALAIQAAINMTSNVNETRRSGMVVSLHAWHFSICDFIRLNRDDGKKGKKGKKDKKTGERENTDRLNTLNTQVLHSDLLFYRALCDETWTVFCPSVASKLISLSENEFVEEYERLERESLIPGTMANKYSRRFRARDLWQMISESNGNSGKPYGIAIDTVNGNYNMKLLGIILSSNLCTEIAIRNYDNRRKNSFDSVAICNLFHVSFRHSFLMSLSVLAAAAWETILKTKRIYDFSNEEIEIQHSLSKFVDFDALGEAARRSVVMANGIIDNSMYRIPSYENVDLYMATNRDDRNIGIGVSGVGNLNRSLRLKTESLTYAVVDECLFANHYFNVLAQSVIEAYKFGAHNTFQYSQYARGLFQFDRMRLRLERLVEAYPRMKPLFDKYYPDTRPVHPRLWNQKVIQYEEVIIEPTWSSLMAAIQKYGLRNALHTSIQPTATTSQVIGNSESMTIPDTNAMSRKTSVGEFAVFDRNLSNDLYSMGHWTPEVCEYIYKHQGSVAGIAKAFGDDALTNIEEHYKTVYEIEWSVMIRLNSYRQKYINQLISFDMHIQVKEGEDFNDIHSNNMMLGMVSGLGTLQYYCREYIPSFVPDGIISSAPTADISCCT